MAFSQIKALLRHLRLNASPSRFHRYGSMGVWEYGRCWIADGRWRMADGSENNVPIQNPHEPRATDGVKSKIQNSNSPTPPHPHTPTQNAFVRTTWARLLSWSTLLVCALVLTTGCEESVNPILGTERPFTIYGFFNPVADTQAVRVFAIEDLLELTRPEPLDARVTSFDVQLGAQHVWQDSVVMFERARYGHVYWSAFRAEYRHRYRLEVTRSDGESVQVEVTVPPLSEAVLLEPTIAPRFVFMPVLWQDAPRVNNIRVRYYTSCGFFDFDYGLEQEQVEGGTVVTIRFSDDARLIFAEVFFEPSCTIRDLKLLDIQLTVLITNEEWVPPSGVFDAELLVEPGTFSNVENGFGFIGAGYPASFRWEPSDSARVAAGYFLGNDGS